MSIRFYENLNSSSAGTSRALAIFATWDMLVFIVPLSILPIWDNSNPQRKASSSEVNPKVWTAFLIKRLEFGIVLDSSRSVLI